MAIKVSVGSAGYVGVTGLSPASLSVTNDGEVLAKNSVSVATGTDDFTVYLPLPAVGEDIEGAVIIIKSLDGDKNLTIGVETRSVGGVDTTVNLDGGTDALELDADNQVVSFYYINETIGWMAGPATI